MLKEDNEKMVGCDWEWYENCWCVSTEYGWCERLGQV